MNKTLLLILCDFLLLNLLALTRWEKAEPPQASQAPVPELAANAVTQEEDLVEIMRQSLADERAARDELAQRLSATDAELAAREQSLTQLEAERARLAEERNAVTETLTETQRAAADLNRRYSQATQEASMTREQLAQLQRELAEKEAEAERQRQALANLERQQADARRQIEGLTMAVVVAEQEKKNLRETAENLRGQVEIERTERARVQAAAAKLAEANTELAQGVGQLAEKSGELSREIRENRPINANVLFNDFQANRVTARFTASRRGLLGQSTREEDADTVLVTAGGQVYALLHISDTIFSLIENGINWESMNVQLTRGGRLGYATAIHFLVQDPRVVALALDAAATSALGAKVYPIANDPFRFPEAVLIDGNGGGYGEVGFKLDPAEPGFVQVDNRLFRRIFGDFSPSRGDLVFSKTGELLGIMVNSDYCVVLRDFAPLQTIRPGSDIRAQSTGSILDTVVSRVRSLPLKLQ